MRNSQPPRNRPAYDRWQPPTSWRIAIPTPTRRGRRERIERGIYRSHSVACPHSQSPTPRTPTKCACSWQIALPGPTGTTLQRLEGTLSITQVRRARISALAEDPAAALEAQAKKLTVRQLGLEYFRARRAVVEEATLQNDADDFRLRIDPVLGARRVIELSRLDMDAYFADLAVGIPVEHILDPDRPAEIDEAATRRSHRMVSKTIGTLRRVLAYGVDSHGLPNPAAHLRVPPPNTGEDAPAMQVLSPAEQALLYTKGFVNLRSESMVRVGLETMLRKGELIGLRWSDIDLAIGEIQVKRAVYHSRDKRKAGGERTIVKGTKGKRRRVVYMTESLCEVLARYHAECRAAGASGDGLVWPGKDGGPVGECTPNHLLSRALKRAGLAGVTVHGLRHTGATRHFEAGTPLIATSRLLGHKNTWVTATIYEHFTDTRLLKEATATFDAFNPRELPKLLTDAETPG